jgi:pimeloyl-ACP methyl ester carboxylesterase
MATPIYEEPPMKYSCLVAAVTQLLILLVVPNCRAQSALPTRVVPVEGMAMRFLTAGLETRKPGEPIVILESGAGRGLEHFTPILSQLAERTPVFAYDRRGLGESEADSVAQTLNRVATSLHALLQQAKVPPPYVLVGASWGGFYIRKFTTLFPSEVSGLVYLDATDSFTRAELAQLPQGALEAVYTLPPIPADLPPGMRAEIESIASAVRSEFSEMRALQPRQDVPVVVIIAGAKIYPRTSEAARTALVELQIKKQSEWTQASPRGLLLVPSKARHFLFNEEPALVVDAINYAVQHARRP